MQDSMPDNPNTLKRSRSIGNDEENSYGETKRKKVEKPSQLTELTHHDYTVGWVCALPKEQTAAVAMLDQRHAILPKPPNDQNAYTLGSIGNHNIVIACLPKGQVGNIPAATVAAWMISTFPSIKFGLMVGIGGGIPPKVRLGDVVVSTTAGQFPGVVQWDFGKARDGGSFERTGALDNPPTSLLTALTKLETEHELNGSKIPEYIEELKTKWPRLASKYLKSDSLEDILFKSDYSHVSEGTTAREVIGEVDVGDEEEESCKFCDRKEIVKRKPRDLRVHHGLIASGNRVIKDAIFRDKLNKDLGGHVLCVEMEAAGLMNNFPCIVIRGICDYADSHKNKDWQEHAAAVAAAFTKELLEYVQPSDVDGERAARDALTKVGVHVAKIKSKLDRDEEIRIIDWLTPVDYGPQQTDFINRHQHGTGQWLLNSAEYQTWLQTDKQTLFCPGIPGVGKTIITSIVVDDLVEKFRHDGDIGIAYLYCNFRRRDEQKLLDLLASLLKQLSQASSHLPNQVKVLYDKHKDKRTRPSFDEISSTLKFVLDRYSKVFIIVDALDECPSSDACLSKLLSCIFSLQADNAVNFFATSRPIPEIERYFKEGVRLEIIASNEDVHKYVQGHMSHLPKFVSTRPDLQEDIKVGITTAVEGMYDLCLSLRDLDPPLTLARFLLAQLYLDSLKDRTSVTEMKSALKKLMKRSQHEPGEDRKRDVLEQAYKEAVERIDSQMPGFRLLGRKTLSWICCAKRPLTTTELQHALAVKSGDVSIDKDNLREIEDVVSVCAGLVTVDKESNILRLVHYTAQKYFERTQKLWFEDAETDITATCVTYISFRAFDNGSCVTDHDFEQRLQENPLFDYVARNWGRHARRASSKVYELILRFLSNEAKVSASIQAMLVSKLFGGDTGYAQRVPKQITCVHLAACFGLADMIISLESNHDLHSRDSLGRTPLLLAAENGHDAVVKILLAKHGFDINTQDTLYMRTPLSWAAGNGHQMVVELLLAKAGIEPDSKDRDGRTPLSWAAGNGHADVVKLLIANDRVVLDSKATWFCKGRTPLLWAALNGHEAVLRLLLKTGKVNPDSKDDDGRTSLSYMVQQGNEASVELLLATRGVTPDSKDSQNWTPLWWALRNGKLRIAEALLASNRACPNSKDIRGQTPLLWAVEHGNDAVIKLLISKNSIDVNLQDSDGCTPLWQAIEHGNETAVRLLLSKDDMDANAQGSNGWTPLWSALKRGNLHIMKALLTSNCIDPNSQGISAQTPLLWAIEHQNEAAVRLLLSKDNIDINAQDSNGWTPLGLATYHGNEAVVKLLLSKDNIDANVKDCNGRTPLLWAGQHRNETVTKLLLEKDGVEINAKDSNMRTLLLWAAENENEALVKLLLEKERVDVNARDYDSRTPLLWAAYRGNETVMKLLLETGSVDVNVKDHNDRTPLLWAACEANETVVRLLLEQDNVDINAKDSNGRTPLLWAVRYGNEAVAKLLLQKDGININAGDRNGWTPLQWAASYGNEEITEMLLGRDGIDVNADNDGVTPLLLATESGNVTVVELLLGKGANIEERDKDNLAPLCLAVAKGHKSMIDHLLRKGAGVEAKDLLPKMLQEALEEVSEELLQQPLPWAMRKNLEEAFQEPLKELVQDVFRLLVPKPIQNALLGPILKPSQEPLQESVQEPSQELFQDLVELAIRGAFQEPLQEPLQEIFQDLVEQAIRGAFQEPLQEPLQDSFQKVFREAFQEALQQHLLWTVRKAVQESLREITQQHLLRTFRKAIRETQRVVPRRLLGNLLQQNRWIVQKAIEEALQEPLMQERMMLALRWKIFMALRHYGWRFIIETRL